MINENKVTAIILAAGNSTRYGQNRNKNFEEINGKSVLYYSLKKFDDNEYIDNIIIAIKETEFSLLKEVIERENFIKPIKFVIGGNTRQESVYNCITKTDSSIVIIHDGARPLIKQEYINNCLESMKFFDGVTIGVKSKDTIKITDDNNIVVETTKRSNTWLIQTPQCFNRNVLLSLHNKYATSEVTDDCMLLEMDNYRVKILEGDYTNIKITTFEDLKIVEEFLENNNNLSNNITLIKRKKEI